MAGFFSQLCKLSSRQQGAHLLESPAITDGALRRRAAKGACPSELRSLPGGGLGNSSVAWMLAWTRRQLFTEKVVQGTK
jgi:hypothetical protein